MFRSMQSKILTTVIATTALAIVLITVLFYGRSSRMIEENYGENLYARVCQLGDSFDGSLEEIYYLTAKASCDEELEQAVAGYISGGLPDTEHIAVVLREYAKRNSDLESIYLLIPEHKVMVTSKDYPVRINEMTNEIMEEYSSLSEHTMTPAIMKDPTSDTSAMLSFVSPLLNEDGTVYAYLSANIEERNIYYKYLDGLENRGGSKAMILNEKGLVVSMKRQNQIGMEFEEKAPGQYKNGVQFSSDGKEIGVSYQTSFSGCYFYMETARSQVLSDLQNIRYFLLVILFLAISAVVILSFFITRAMNRPLRKLAEAMGEVGDGDLDTRVEVTTKDEIGSLSRDFNHMLEHIQGLIQQLVQEETLKKNAELEALQYQITPHFMYNTLNAIKYSALLKGEMQTSQYIDDFVELLQASINKKGVFVTVAEELHFLKNYLRLQNMRYEEEIAVIYEIEQGTTAYFLPRLMFQPLVENAILHGLDLKRGKNHIIIGAKVVDEVLFLSVKDNGRGMSGEQIQKILTVKEKKNHGLSGIGVANVRERLQLYYGEAAGIRYESSESGTLAILYMPAYKEEDKYAI